MTAIKSKPLISWALYDFANTIFSAIVLTSFFPLYLTSLTGSNWQLGATSTFAMAASGICLPLFGALADSTGKTKSYLFRFTLVSVILLFIVGVIKNVPLILICYIGSTFCFHAAMVFYNALLPVVASPEIQGKVSGLGTGLGYLGTVISLPIAYQVEKLWGTPAVFMMAAIFFFICSIPSFLWVPETSVESSVKFNWGLWKKEWQKLNELIRIIAGSPQKMLFFGGHFFVVDALNGTILWFMVYAREVFHPGTHALIGLLLAVNFSAFLAGILYGFLTDRFGAYPMLLGASGFLVLTLFLLGVTQNFAQFSWVVIIGGAFAISGIWTSGRKVLIELAEEQKIGQYFGLYGLTTKLSVIGSLVFAVISDVMGFHAALMILLFPAAIGFGLLTVSAASSQKS